MKFMGWGPEDLYMAPETMVTGAISEMIKETNDEIERANKSR